jgi:hypothetical protein
MITFFSSLGLGAGGRRCRRTPRVSASPTTRQVGPWGHFKNRSGSRRCRARKRRNISRTTFFENGYLHERDNETHAACPPGSHESATHSARTLAGPTPAFYTSHRVGPDRHRNLPSGCTSRHARPTGPVQHRVQDSRSRSLCHRTAAGRSEHRKGQRLQVYSEPIQAQEW